MPDLDLDARLAEMATRRRDARRVQHRRDAVMELLDRDGAVDTDTLDQHLADTWTEPSRADMAAQMAQKAHAAVEHTAAQIEILQGKAEDARTARDQAVLTAQRAEDGIDVADAALTAALRDHEQALALAAHVDGDPYQAPPPTTVAAGAEAAHVSSEGELNR